jgi:apolipoprotein N-acyltransferase
VQTETIDTTPLARLLQRRSARFLFAALSGVAFGCAFPDYSIYWLIFIALIPLVAATVSSSGKREAFLLGWLSQTVAWLVMVPWVVRVMSHYGGLPYYLGILIYIAMALYLGMYGGLFTLLVRAIRPGPLFGRWMLVPLAWAAVEYVRTYLFTGFPWNLIAAAIVDYSSLVQFDRVAGPYALGVMILLPGTVLAWLLMHRSFMIQKVLAIGGVGILTFVWWATGLVATKMLVRPTDDTPVHAALLQPNISQEMRWNQQKVVEIFQQMTAMTEEAVAHGARVIIWPESTVPLTYETTDFFREYVEAVSRDHNADIILGSVAEGPSGTNQLWNSAYLVSNGKTIGHYDKIRLVPFGEYVPMRKALFFAQKLVRDVGEFTFGTRDTPLGGFVRYGPAICYEVVYPQITAAQVRNGADVLVTITNDAWYDGTSAPRQHLNQARLRAVEGDRYMLRAGTTGISALIEPTGAMTQQLPMGRQGIIYADFWPRHSRTAYVRFGDWFAWVSCAAVLLAMFVRIRRDRVNAVQGERSVPRQSGS